MLLCLFFYVLSMHYGALNFKHDCKFLLFYTQCLGVRNNTTHPPPQSCYLKHLCSGKHCPWNPLLHIAQTVLSLLLLFPFPCFVLLLHTQAIFLCICSHLLYQMPPSIRSPSCISFLAAIHFKVLQWFLLYNLNWVIGLMSWGIFSLQRT
jgi:hypothetical protein